MNEVNDLLDQMEVILHNIKAIRKGYEIGGGTKSKVGGGTTNRWHNEFVGI